jgi:hypothetical protein
MGRTAKEKPADGGAVRAPIMDMLAPGDEKTFEESLPASTATSSEDSETGSKPKRKYTKRAKTESKSSDTPVDARLERAQQKCAGLGMASVVEAGFTMAGKPLEDQETEDVSDQFYLISNKIGGSGDSWLFIAIYTIALLARLVMKRTELGEEVSEWLKKMFQPKEEVSVDGKQAQK